MKRDVRVHIGSLELRNPVLVASGIIVPVTAENASTLSSNDLAYLRSFIDREKRGELMSLVARRNKVKVAAFARRSGRMN